MGSQRYSQLLSGDDFDAMDTENIAYRAAAAPTVRDFFAAAREFFHVLSPPTVPP